MIFRRLTKKTYLFAVFLLHTASVQALTSDVVSNRGDSIIQSNDGNIGNMAVEIDPENEWQLPGPSGRGAVWISSQDSGVVGTSPPSDPESPFFTYRETFDLRHESNDHRLQFTIWADDTASVTLDGVTIFAENTTQDFAGAEGPVSCEPDEGGFFVMILAAGEVHNLDIAVFQVGGGPMGVLLSGEIGPITDF